MVILLSWFGVVALMMSLVPVVAISPILLYIGMLIGAQAFQETPKSHAPRDRPGAGPARRGLGQAPDRQRAQRGGVRRAETLMGILPDGMYPFGGTTYGVPPSSRSERVTRLRRPSTTRCTSSFAGSFPKRTTLSVRGVIG